MQFNSQCQVFSRPY